ncbi:dienelactone hydrolase family protein [Ramlibacter sp. AW1]|uniref:Dienelactone hydrolase family protein n=1 Tax=Ramlibacter aurantiacus TaxID=2801330 RepID=A0A936ZKG7_9BURK|nr:dienelactone hydrolase family protein [Ramlibacter aurantiacus]MBL0419371.1 dienelactone hydrolase family protein [Ramlibacter aurantiacus]
MTTPRNETIAADGGASFQAYVSEPKQPNGHAVIVLQEIFGVTRHIRAIADRFAADGWLACAPDLFWREQPGIELSHSKEDIEKAFAIMGRYRDDDGMADIDAVARHVRARPGFDGRVAVAGMCLGGKLAYLAAARCEVDAAIAYYGVGIEKHLDLAPGLRCPLQMHFGDQDRYVPAEARAQIAQAVAGKPVQVHTYPGADHGFYTRGAEADIALARERSNEFLRQHLKR